LRRCATSADLARVDQFLALLLAEVEGGDAGGIFDKPDDRKVPRFAVLIFSQPSLWSER
jgi:hypothetical protein